MSTTEVGRGRRQVFTLSPQGRRRRVGAVRASAEPWRRLRGAPEERRVSESTARSLEARKGIGQAASFLRVRESVGMTEFSLCKYSIRALFERHDLVYG